MSPSLRGSGLKYMRCFLNAPAIYVSLFMREWIEILPLYEQRPSGAVSLFTREWIEIDIWDGIHDGISSPSLRGSGLKCRPVLCVIRSVMSPSLRGSGLKSFKIIVTSGYRCPGLPLYEGVD